jgi:hypothetical protein
VANVYQVNRGATQATPEPSVTNSVASIGAFASYNAGFSSLVLSGTANDSDSGQTLTVQYQIDATSGTWNNLKTLTANASNQAWSGTIALPAGLTAGTHTIYVRIYDGYAYSANKTMSFVLDTAAPTNSAALVGGVKCTGITSIYCTAPTGVNLSASADSQAGIGAYRTQWDSVFTAAATTPAWISGAAPTNLATTNHTAAARTHTLYYQTRDKVGNTATVGSVSYYVNAAPTITLNDASHNHTVTAYTPLVFNGSFSDADASQSATVKATINGVAYTTSAYPTTGGAVNWELVIPASALAALTPDKLTNITLTVTDSAGSNASTTYTGKIAVSAAANAEIYLSVIKNTPFALTIGKVGAFNITYGTNNGVTVATNDQAEIIVSGQLSSSTRITFGVTTLVFNVLEEPSLDAQEIEFI